MLGKTNQPRKWLPLAWHPSGRNRLKPMQRAVAIDELSGAERRADAMHIPLLNRHQIGFGPIGTTLTPELLRATYGGQALQLRGDGVIVARP